MRDVSLDEFAEELRDELASQGVNVSRGTVQVLTHQFFEYIEKIIAKTPEVTFNMYHKDIISIFTPVDKRKLCDEFAAGYGVSYDTLLRKRKLSRKAAAYLRRISNTMEDKYLEADPT